MKADGELGELVGRFALRSTRYGSSRGLGSERVVVHDMMD